MKATIERATLLKSLSHVQSVVERRNTIPILANVLIEATGDGICEAAVLMRYEMHVRPEPSRSPAWADAQWEKIDRALAALEERWMSHLSGPVDMGQIAIGCALGYLDLRHSDRNWRATRPALAAWYEGFARRPAMQATAPAA